MYEALACLLDMPRLLISCRSERAAFYFEALIFILGLFLLCRALHQALKISIQRIATLFVLIFVGPVLLANTVLGEKDLNSIPRYRELSERFTPFIRPAKPPTEADRALEQESKNFAQARQEPALKELLALQSKLRDAVLTQKKTAPIISDLRKLLSESAPELRTWVRKNESFLNKVMDQSSDPTYYGCFALTVESACGARQNTNVFELITLEILNFSVLEPNAQNLKLYLARFQKMHDTWVTHGHAFIDKMELMAVRTNFLSGVLLGATLTQDPTIRRELQTAAAHVSINQPQEIEEGIDWMLYEGADYLIHLHQDFARGENDPFRNTDPFAPAQSKKPIPFAAKMANKAGLLVYIWRLDDSVKWALQEDLPKFEWTSYLYNPIGRVLESVARPNFQRYRNRWSESTQRQKSIQEFILNSKNF
jgi:hypothetical protein